MRKFHDPLYSNELNVSILEKMNGKRNINNILIFGSSGQLAKEFIKTLSKQGLEYIAPAEELSSITDFKLVADLLERIKPKIIINCAAYNDVESAENNTETAFLVNSQAVEHLAQQCEKRGIFLVHFSSDYVFDGQKKTLYTENDNPNPLNVYGKSKLEGENAVCRIMSHYLVFRLSWVIGLGTQNFLYKLSGWAEKNPVLKISADEVSIPTFTDNIVNVTMMALERGLEGLYHLTNSGLASRFELADYFIKKKKMQNELIPVPMSTFGSAVDRPLFTAMSNQKLQDELRIKIPHWKEGVDRFCNRIE
jgi:dTDP-4-dehydrorhamnose reductase